MPQKSRQMTRSQRIRPKEVQLAAGVKIEG
jgi:hypothetical protein